MSGIPTNRREFIENELTLEQSMRKFGNSEFSAKKTKPNTKIFSNLILYTPPQK